MARLAVLGSSGLLAVPGPVQSLEVARPVPRVSESIGMGGGTRALTVGKFSFYRNNIRRNRGESITDVSGR